jgi:hypothetical protein
MPLTGKKHSSALFSSKNATINVYSDEVGKPIEAKQPKCVRVEEAENGFIINIGYDKKPIVAESIEKAVEALKSHFA